jgi:hypothetical protein
MFPQAQGVRHDLMLQHRMEMKEHGAFGRPVTVKRNASLIAIIVVVAVGASPARAQADSNEVAVEGITVCHEGLI